MFLQCEIFGAPLAFEQKGIRSASDHTQTTLRPFSTRQCVAGREAVYITRSDSLISEMLAADHDQIYAPSHSPYGHPPHIEL
eukprot:s3163_g3.t1